MLLELHAQEQTILVVVTHSPELADTVPRMLVMAKDGSGSDTRRPPHSTSIRPA